MAKNKIRHEWNEDGTAIIFTGSQRQPTLVEIKNYAADLARTTGQFISEGVYAAACVVGGDWAPPEDHRSVMLVQFDENCPICGKPFVLDTDFCPVVTRSGMKIERRKIMTREERKPTGLLHSADELKQLIVENLDLPILVFAVDDTEEDEITVPIDIFEEV